MATSFLAVYSHGSGETLDYSIDWSEILAADSDVADSATWAIEKGTPTLGNGSNGAPAPSLADSVASVWLVGGTVGDEYHLQCTLVTSGGRTHERSLKIFVADK